MMPGGTSKIIAFICKTFSDEATRWSAFEREFYCFKEGHAAIERYVAGFKVFMYFDHKNIERAEVVLKSRRASKKLINWVADSQHLLATVVRVWIDCKNTVLPDVGSRISWEGVVAKHLPVPHGPVRDFIRDLFTHPDKVEADIAKQYRDSGVGA